MVLRYMLLPAAVLLLTLGAAAQAADDKDSAEGGEVRIVVKSDDSTPADEAEVMYIIKRDDGESYAVKLDGEESLIESQAALSEAVGRLQVVVDKLLLTEELSREGCAELQASVAELEELVGQLDLPLTFFQSTINLEASDTDDPETTKQVYTTVEVVTSGDEDEEGKVVQKRLMITIDEDGEVKIDGEGFSEEELEQIRHQVEEGQGSVIALGGLEDLMDLDDLEQLKQLQELEGLEKLEGLAGLEQLYHLEEMPWLLLGLEHEDGDDEDLDHEDIDGEEWAEAWAEWAEKLEKFHQFEGGECLRPDPMEILKQLDEHLEDRPDLKRRRHMFLFQDGAPFRHPKGKDRMHIRGWPEHFEHEDLAFDEDWEAELDELLEEIEGMLRQFMQVYGEEAVVHES